MKLTRKILNEMVREAMFDRLLSEAAGGGLYSVPSADLLTFAKEYSALGAAVQEQLQELGADPTAMVNPAAVRMIQAKLGGVNAELDEMLNAWYSNNT